MKPTIVLALLISLWTPLAFSAIVVPGADGTDGALNITTNTVIDLSLAVDGVWDAAGTSAGVYDSNKWAVVYKYSAVNISSNATVTFKNHPSRAPVVWLVSGNVTIDGVLSLDGQDNRTAPALSEPGPGGFRGGTATFGSTGGVRASAGFGVGGGQRLGNVGNGGNYGDGLLEYGNPSLVPLIGGSGGSGDPEFTNFRVGGGAGGGAILVACQNVISLNGQLHANGGRGTSNGSGTDTNTGGGSGGGVRLVCDVLSGSGVLHAIGGSGWSSGSVGRVRLERATNQNALTVLPGASVVNLQPTATALIWPPTDAPEIRVLSIGGGTVPPDPRASFGTLGADVALSDTNTVQVVVQTVNVEQASQLKVRYTPRFNAGFTEVDAVVESVVSADPLVIRWTADVPTISGYGAVQVRAIRP